MLPSELGEGRARSLLRPCIGKEDLGFFGRGYFDLEPPCFYLLKC